MKKKSNSILSLTLSLLLSLSIFIYFFYINIEGYVIASSIPQYSNSREFVVNSSAGLQNFPNGVVSAGVSFISNDDYNDVYDFYIKQLEIKGWEKSGQNGSLEFRKSMGFWSKTYLVVENAKPQPDVWSFQVLVK